MNHLVCYRCGKTYTMNDPVWRCLCGYILDIKFKPVFNLNKINSGKPTMWRYREAIPVNNDSNIVSFDEGFTPLTRLNIQGRPVLIKQEQLSPTGSFKDRGAAVLISKIKELNISEVVEDSSGNAGAAISAYCTAAGIECSIYVPESTSKAKLVQIIVNGAKLNRVKGTREDTANAVLKSAEKIYYASHVYNPFFFQGTKTIAYEICEQLDWVSPDTVILPVGHGSLLLGMHTGFSELLYAGLIKKMPKLIAVQSENCSPLYRTFKSNLKKIHSIEKKETVAEGIAIANPVRGIQIIDAVKESNGDFIAVSENEIIQSLGETCKKGYYIEPTSASAVAGIKKYLDMIKDKDEVVVSVFTGHGLKSTDKISHLLDR